MFSVRLLLLPAMAHAFFRFHQLHMRRETVFDKATLRVGESRGTFAQILDHDNPGATTWKQRYFVSEQYYTTGGPVFLVLGGEGEAGSGSNLFYSSSVAQKHGALVAVLEHRFYGRSYPTPDMSTENLRYLSSRQALSDAVNFISAIKHNSLGLKSQVAADAKVIVIGGSYAGNLAAWLRLKYPSVVHGAVASSGPVLAKYNFKEYLEVVGASLARHSQECVDDIQKGIAEVYEVLKDPAKTEALTQQLALCDPIDPSNERDVSIMFEGITTPFAYAAQNDGGWHVKTVCDDYFLKNRATRSALVRLGDTARDYYRTCVQTKYAGFIDYLRETANPPDPGAWLRQWMYQTCTEFGYYQSTDSPNQPFGHSVPATLYSEACSEAYGPQFNVSSVRRAVENTNAYYGGLNLRESNIAFFNGGVDPWHALGITETNEPGQIAVFAEDASHCLDMYKPTRWHPKSMAAAREKMEAFVDAMLKQ